MSELEDVERYITENGTVASKLAIAKAMIDGYVGEAYVPEPILTDATYQLAQELYTRQKSPGGFTQFGDSELVGRLARDPMTSIYPMLRPWLTPFA